MIIHLDNWSPLEEQFVQFPFKEKGGGMSLETSFEVSKPLLITSVSSLLPDVDQDMSSQLLVQHHACLPGTMLQAMTMMD